MDDTAIVGVVHRPGQHLRDPRSLLDRHRARRQPPGQVLPFDHFQRQVGGPVRLADLMDFHDIGVVQTGGGLGLPVEPVELFRVDAPDRPDHLQGDPPLEPHLRCKIDDPHAADADLAKDLVARHMRVTRAVRYCLGRFVTAPCGVEGVMEGDLQLDRFRELGEPHQEVSQVGWFPRLLAEQELAVDKVERKVGVGGDRRESLEIPLRRPPLV